MRPIEVGAILVLLSGCATLGGAERAGGALPRPLEETWPEALKVLEEEGFEVVSLSSEHVAVTRWRESMASSKIAVRVTRYTVHGERLDDGGSRIRFFRHEGFAQDVLPAQMTEWGDRAGAEGKKELQKQAAHGTTSRRFHAKLHGDPELEKTFQFKPKSLTLVRDHHLEEVLAARIAGLPPPPVPPERLQKSVPEGSEQTQELLSQQVCGSRVPGWSDVMAGATTILIGEIPGTVEVPKLTGQFACDALVRGHPVVLLLEIPVEEQPRIDAFLASDGQQAARDALLNGFFWGRPHQDGRSSAAMLSLLEHARQLWHAGFPLRVHAIDHPNLVGPDRGAAMAEEILKARRFAAGAVLLALVGNLHVPAQTEPAPRTLGGFLARAGEPLVALTLAYQRGKAWTCVDAEKLDCREHHYEATPAHFRAWHWATPPGDAFQIRSPSIRRWSGRRDGLDGTFYLSEFTASPPARSVPASH